MTSIVAVNLEWGIGYKGELLEKVSGDLQHFKELTSDKIVVMGRKTWDSLNHKPFKNRFNIIITRNPPKDSLFDNVAFITLEDFLAIKDELEKKREIFVIGGDSIYKQLLQYCDTAYVTKFYAVHGLVDTYFPNLDEMKDWSIVSTSEMFKENNLIYQFYCYGRNQLKN